MKRFGFGVGIGQSADSIPIVLPTKMVEFDGVSKYFDLGALDLNSILQSAHSFVTLIKLGDRINDGTILSIELGATTYQFRMMWNNLTEKIEYQISSNGTTYGAIYTRNDTTDSELTWLSVGYSFNPEASTNKMELYLNDFHLAYETPVTEGNIFSTVGNTVQNTIPPNVLSYKGHLAYMAWFTGIKNGSDFMNFYNNGDFNVPSTYSQLHKCFNMGDLSDLTTGLKDQEGTDYGAFNNAVAGDLQAFA